MEGVEVVEGAFDALVADIPAIGLEWHGLTLLWNSTRNAPKIDRTIRDIAPDGRACLVVSAGPSLAREGMLERIGGFRGCVVAVDAAYVACLKAGVAPDWVITLDPHPTRVVRWFGGENANPADTYFERQEIALPPDGGDARLVDEKRGRLVICTASDASVEGRTAGMERYWYVPLVDEPGVHEGLTHQMVKATGAPALNTGGTVGTAAWVFAHSVLRSPDIALIGTDLAYYGDTPYERTQSWNMLKDKEGFEQYYPRARSPDGREFYTDPTYRWYRDNFLTLLANNEASVTNCSGAGLFFGAGVTWKSLEEWLNGLA